MISNLDNIGIHGLKKVTTTEAAGPCPMCGGRDRFHVHAIREWPSWLWMCRVCSPEWRWLDEYDERLKRSMSPDEMIRLANERALMEKARKEELQKSLARFSTAQLWQELHRRMNEDNREWWRARGIPDEWQDYLQLGYIPDKIITGGAHSPAYTIPYLRGSQAVTMQYRLTNPPDPKDKYRFEAGLPSAWYATNPAEPLKDQVIICEGAIKAMVTAIYSNTTAAVVAVPSKTSWAGIQQTLKDAGRVWVVLDPDGQAEAEKLARAIGQNARIVTLPGKIDDMILAGFEPAELKQAFRYGRRMI